MRGQKPEDCNSLAKEIWECYIEKNSAAHILGCNNVEANLYSRKLEDIIKTFGTPDLDLFDSRLDKQLPKCFSWHPEPKA